MGSRGQEEFVLALDIQDGRQLWSTKVGLVGENTGPNYPGPRSTPTVDGNALYTLGSDGDLVCADTATGKIRWQKHLLKDFQGNRGTWAYAESPLVDGEAVVCTPGGATATMVALDKKTGAVRWKTEKPERNGAGYASAIMADVGGLRQYIQFLGTGLIGVSARDGKLLWTYNRHIGFASAGTPIFHDSCVFSSSSGTDGAGGDALVRLSADGDTVKAKEVYLVRAITNFHGGVVRMGDYLYGTAGAALVCMDFKTGTRKWRERAVGGGSLVAADGHLYVRGEQGDVALVETNPEGYKEKGRFRQPDRSRFATFCHPVVAGGRLYLRDEDVLLCYDVKEK
jgi:outer membrane protein assembly factor BamB